MLTGPEGCCPVQPAGFVQTEDNFYIIFYREFMVCLNSRLNDEALT